MRTFEVKILGQRYKIRSDEGEDYIQRLASYVNEQILETQRSSRSVATHNAAVLTALNIADSLFKQRETESQLKKEVRDRIRRLLKLVRTGREAAG